MDRPLIVIFTAIRMEARAVADVLDVRLPSQGQGAGAIAGWGIELHAVGVRATRLPSTLPERTACVIMAGLGGGLDPALRVGDVVLDWPNELPDLNRLDGVTLGRIHTSGDPVCTPPDKLALFRATGAAAVDMESEPARQLARSAGVPFVGVRAISDSCHDTIDPALLGLIDDIGRPRALALSRYLLRHPGRIGRLRQLGAASRRAAVRLAEAVANLLRDPTFLAPLTARAGGANIPPAGR